MDQAGTRRLDGKRVLITGAGSGIGRSAAVRFAAEGASVAVVDAAADAAENVVAEIVGSGGTARAHVADVGAETEIEAAFTSAANEFGGLDVVIANAAVQLFDSDARVHELDARVWDRTHTVNLRGAFLTCKHGVRALLTSGGGSLICTGSGTGQFGLAPASTAYSSSKAGVHGLARAIAAGYGADGIRCNVVIPGFTATPLVTQVLDDPTAVTRIVERIPMGRPGMPADVAAMMVFLASDESAYVTGALFTVDGGRTAR